MESLLHLYQAIGNNERLYCRVVKLADTPPCLGGGDHGKS